MVRWNTASLLAFGVTFVIGVLIAGFSRLAFAGYVCGNINYNGCGTTFGNCYQLDYTCNGITYHYFRVDPYPIGQCVSGGATCDDQNPVLCRIQKYFTQSVCNCVNYCPIESYAIACAPSQ
jgi:hypothetical protein